MAPTRRLSFARSRRLRVLRGERLRPRLGADGCDIDVSDLLELLSDFGAGGGGSSDLDVSGVVDVADLLAVLSRFGAAC